MEPDYDLCLRLALFEHVDRLRRETGGVALTVGTESTANA